ncbi:bifunctional endoribonuclease/protein kinase ire1 [Tulasnella sp. 419]|nr:bifunctional endoribonuclease/protein kinase ire1 [Tulasnella sp. 419]
MHSFEAALLSLAAISLATFAVLSSAAQQEPPAYQPGHNTITSLQKYAAKPNVNVHHEDTSYKLDLLDTVVVASVDGRFHAVNRTNGRLIWSMDQPLLISPEAQPTFHSLVRSDHSSLLSRGSTALDDFDEPLETYIIEPQSGNIFVNPPNARRDAPLQRLPFSMSQLVDLSPFRFDDQRTFVGKKSTSFITLDLETGELLELIDSDRWCPWTNKKQDLSGDEMLLDELEEEAAPRRVRKRIHIGKTDYHVTVYSEERIVQNLTFSSYGPNNMDKDKQALWKQTPDNRYHQPLPDGNLMVLKVDESQPLQARMEFQQPIVAVFDAVSLEDGKDPLVLLQPVPSLTNLFPGLKGEIAEITEELTYVGKIGRSLYAMSHSRFPLVAIHQSVPKAKTINSKSDADPASSSELEPYESEAPICDTLDCLTGVHLSESASASRLSRLIEEGSSQGRQGRLAESLSLGIASSTPLAMPATPTKSTVTALPSVRWPELDPPPAQNKGRWTSPLLTAFSVIAVLVWVFAKKLGISTKWNFERYIRTPALFGQMRIEESRAEGLPGVPAAFQHSISVPSKPLPPLPPAEAEVVNPVPTPSSPPSGPVVTDSDSKGVDDGEGDGDSDKEGNAETPKKKGPRRRKRGKGGKKSVVLDVPEKEEEDEDDVEVNPPKPRPTKAAIIHVTEKPPAEVSASSLIVSDQVLGFGSHGTMVYQGTFQGRAVAVKRLLQDFVTLAAREVALLQESDDHPNVIRYYFKESKNNFLYIALELCPASLADIVERPDNFKDISIGFDPKKALSQVTMGLRHLHSLKIVHRDIKPQNILVSKPNTKTGAYRMLISDFGLCRKLESDQTSFLPTAHGAMGAGTVGWRAPEILRGEVKLDEQTFDMSSGGTPNSSVGGTGSVSGGSTRGGVVTRLTKSVDVFALGCLFYYTLTGGEHPFGDRYEREMNILKNEKNLSWLERLGEEGAEAEDLISKMLDPDPKSRPDTTSCLVHPFFWDPARRLAFLQDASDRFEIMERDPKEAPLVALEANALQVVGPDWHRRLDKLFIDNLGKFRKYDGKSVQDLLRALRNKVSCGPDYHFASFLS